MSEKLKLNPDATFKAFVFIQRPGLEPVPVEFEFKQRSLSELTAFNEALNEIDLIDNPARQLAAAKEKLRECVSGWDLDAAFTPENLDLLIENYPNCHYAVFHRYFEEYGKARLGN